MSEADNKPSDEESQEPVEMRTVRVEFSVPDDLSIQYADNVNVFFSDYDFTLTFLQTQAPLIVRPEDWGEVQNVKSKGVARVVVPPHLIPRIIEVLAQNWNKFLKIKDQKETQEQSHVSTTTATPSNTSLEADKS